MPEDGAAPVEDTQQEAPDTSGPEGTPAADSQESSPAIDYEKRYNDLRSEFDSRNQRYSQYEQFVRNLQDPETQSEALRALGLEIEADEEPDDIDPDERWEKRFSEIEQHLQRQAEAAEAAELQELESQFFDQEFGQLEKKHGELSKEERETVQNLASVMRDDEGIPDVEGAFNRLNGIVETRHKKYVETKKAPKVELGEAGTEKVNLNDDDARTALLADMLEAEAS